MKHTKIKNNLKDYNDGYRMGQLSMAIFIIVLELLIYLILI